MKEEVKQEQSELEVSQSEKFVPAMPETASTAEAEIIYRPDPRFKLWTMRLAERLGIIVRTAELPQTGIADLVFELPGDMNPLIGTLFEFLADFNFAIVDFKGENDNLTMKKLQQNVSRTSAFAAENDRVPVEKILNLIVSSRFPQEVIKAANSKPGKPELIQQPGKPWLWRSSSYVQEIAIVVCRDLPLEPEYFDWLLFAPVNTDTWKRFARTILDQSLYDYIVESFKLHPKEMREMRLKTSEYWNDLDPREQKRLSDDWLEVITAELADWKVNNRDYYKTVLGVFKAEDVAEVVPTDELVKVLPTEEVVRALPTEEVVRALPTEQVVEAVPTEKLLAALSPEKLEALEKLIAERKKANKLDAN